MHGCKVDVIPGFTALSLLRVIPPGLPVHGTLPTRNYFVYRVLLLQHFPISLMVSDLDDPAS